MPASPEPTARQQLLRLQKATFARLEEDFQAGFRRESRHLRSYRRQYEKEVRNFRRVSTKAELIDDVARADIVYCGDYHTLRQAQRTAIKILRAVGDRRKPTFLGLEVVPQNGEKSANDFVRGRIDEETFLEAIAYEKKWGFPWSHYRQLFDFARERKLRILGLNSPEGDSIPLNARDDLAADLIVGVTLCVPEALIFCLYGDLHLADAHIPERVRIRLKSQNASRNMLTIFQNSEPIYWELAERGLSDTVDVVEVAADKYCVLSAAPWVKWQSYQSWLEDQSELLSEGGEEAVPDYYHQVLERAEKIARFLGVRPSELEHFSVYTATDADVASELEKYCIECGRKDFPVEDLVRAEILENRSIYLPERSILYLNDLSENRAAEKAAQLVASKLQSTPAVFGPASSPSEIFYRAIIWEAIGFFGSKILNPKRKCDQYRDFERFLIRTRKRKLRGRLRDQREAAIAVLAHRAFELKRVRTGRTSGIPRKIFRLSPAQLFLAASAIGQIFADRLYYGMVTDLVSMNDVRELFSPLPNGAGAASERYWALVKRLPSRRMSAQSKEDRF
ncbi:MAG TPA: ChaN family lipoprotein [Bdellovibrionota bacterium]|nr:ChaN family lipoprotein [Bdellovibrionota bacterium]